MTVPATSRRRPSTWVALALDGERLVGAFGERLRDELDLETIRTDVLATVDAVVRPATSGLWLRERAEGGR